MNVFEEIGKRQVNLYKHYKETKKDILVDIIQFFPLEPCLVDKDGYYDCRYMQVFGFNLELQLVRKYERKCDKIFSYLGKNILLKQISTMADGSIYVEFKEPTRVNAHQIIELS